MKIKCINTSLNISENFILNSDMKEYMKLDDVFLVHGLRFLSNITYAYVYNGNHLFEVPIEMFKVVDESVPNKWKIKIWDDKSVTLWPDLFYENEFFENFAEHEKKERELFKKLNEESE